MIAFWHWRVNSDFCGAEAAGALISAASIAEMENGVPAGALKATLNNVAARWRDSKKTALAAILPPNLH